MNPARQEDLATDEHGRNTEKDKEKNGDGEEEEDSFPCFFRVHPWLKFLCLPSTRLVENIPIVGNDSALDAYGIERLW